ncbi:MAG: amidohydrolase family protein, partial [Candidatus Limnocylindria bacterium]
VRYATHLLNAMRGLDPRAPGIAVGLLLDPRVTIGLIADGHHLAPATLALAWSSAGPSRSSLVTDAIAALGAAPGRHRLGEMEVELSADGSVRLPDGRLAGAATSLDAGLRRLWEATGCTRAEAVASVTAVPAGLLGLPDRGHLAPGARGDAVLLDDDLRVVATVVSGQPAHGAEALGWD